jgi:exonuclease SbcD
MRVIHTSDWHLGQYFYGKSRANEHQKFLTWLIEQVNQQQIDVIIVAGDIFDTSTPPSYAREMYFDFVAKLQSTSCQLILLAGNHDSVAMLSEAKPVLASLSTQVITHVTPIMTLDGEQHSVDEQSLKQQVFPLFDNTGQAIAIICAVPFIRPRDVIKSKAGQSSQDKQQSLQQAISEHYSSLHDYALQLAENLKNNIDKTNDCKVPIIATGHLTALGVSINDSKSSAVRDIYIGSLEAFPAANFPPADYIALGHIHRSQKVANNDHIRYCGSPIALSFDEAKQSKKILIAEFKLGKLDNVKESMIPCFQPLYSINTTLMHLQEALQVTLRQFELYLSNTPPVSEEGFKPDAWLNIEVVDSQYVNDLSNRVSELVDDFPFEVLLVRRCKNAHQQHSSLLKQTQLSLSELSLIEVFESRLAEVAWDSEEEIARKSRLKQLYEQCSNEVNTGENIADNLPGGAEPHKKTS